MLTGVDNEMSMVMLNHDIVTPISERMPIQVDLTALNQTSSGMNRGNSNTDTIARDSVNIASDINSQAAKRFADTGVAASCQTIQTQNQGGTYSQNVCTVPGSQQVYDANLTAAMTPQQIAAVLAQEYAVVGKPTNLLATPNSPISTQVFNTPSNTALTSPVTAVPVTVISDEALTPKVSYAPNTTTLPVNTPITSPQGNDWKDVFSKWMETFTTTLTPKKEVVTTNTNPTNSVATAFGPGISYNDINPDGTAVQSSPTGVVTDIFSFLDSGVSIGGVNIPFWALGLAGFVTLKAVMKGRR